MFSLGHLESLGVVKTEIVITESREKEVGNQSLGRARKKFHPKKMSADKKTLGVGAVVSVLSRMLHPSAAIRERYTNPQPRHILENLLVIRKEVRKINRRDQMAIVMRHDEFPGIELYCIEKFVHITTSGPPEHYFTDTAAVATSNQEGDGNGQDNNALPDEVVAFLDSDRIPNENANYIANLIPTDDDNEPAPENIPQGDHFATLSGEWGHD